MNNNDLWFFAGGVNFAIIMMIGVAIDFASQSFDFIGWIIGSVLGWVIVCTLIYGGKTLIKL